MHIIRNTQTFAFACCFVTSFCVSRSIERQVKNICTVQPINLNLSFFFFFFFFFFFSRPIRSPCNTIINLKVYNTHDQTPKTHCSILGVLDVQKQQGFRCILLYKKSCLFSVKLAQRINFDMYNRIDDNFYRLWRRGPPIAKVLSSLVKINLNSLGNCTVYSLCFLKQSMHLRPSQDKGQI